MVWLVGQFWLTRLASVEYVFLVKNIERPVRMSLVVNWKLVSKNLLALVNESPMFSNSFP